MPTSRLRNCAGRMLTLLALLVVATLSLTVATLAGTGTEAIASEGDGGGGGGGSGSGSGGGSNYGTGMDFIWFDRGGFTKTGLTPQQNWGEASIDYFYNLMKNKMVSAHGATEFSDSAPRRQINNKTDRELFYESARTAINNAVRRSNEAGSDATQGRVVGIGWQYEWVNSAKTKWEFYLNGSNQKPFDTLIPRKGDGTELQCHYPTESSPDLWDTGVNHTAESWRDYIYRIGKVDLPGNYSVVIVAVADGDLLPLGYVTMNKVSSTGSVPSSSTGAYSLAGGEFTLYQGATEYGKFTTNADGSVTPTAVSGLSTVNGNQLEVIPGDYVLRETKAPPLGFKTNSEQKGVTVTYDNTTSNPATQTFADEPIYGYIRVVKRNAENGEVIPVAGAEFDLFVQGGTDAIDHAVTDADGIAQFPNAHELQAYEIVETKAPVPYVLDTSRKEVTLAQQANDSSGNLQGGQDLQGHGVADTVIYDFADSPQYGKASITKTDSEDGTPLPGAAYKVILLDDSVSYPAAGDEDRTPSCGLPASQKVLLTKGTVTVNDATHVTQVGNPVVFKTETGVTDTIVTGADGKAETGWLPIDGTSKKSRYAFVEVKAPDGHALSSEQVPFTLTYDSSKASVSATATQTDNPLSLTVKKVLADDDSPIEGARIAFWRKSDNLTVTPDAGCDAYVLRTPSDAIVPIASLVADGTGDYPDDMSERVASLAWDSASNAWVATDLKARSTYQIEIDRTVVARVSTSQEGGRTWMARYATERQTWFADHYIEQAAMPKSDSQMVTGTSSGKSYAYETLTNDEGEVMFTRMAPNEYILAEVVPPTYHDGTKSYLVDTRYYEFSVDGTTGMMSVQRSDALDQVSVNGYELSVSITDEQTDLFIHKQQIVDGPEIVGAQLTLATPDGKVIEEWISTDEPHKVVGLRPGRYSLTERINPKEYERTETIFFTLLPTNEVQHVRMFDAPISIDAEIDKRQEIALPLDERYEPNHEENNAAAQTNETGLYSYSLDFRNTSNTWTDEFTVEDPMEPAHDGYARLVTLITPQAFQDYDGLMNVWYKTNKTPADYVEQPVDSKEKTKADAKSESPSSVSQVPVLEVQDGAEVTVSEDDKAVLSSMAVSVAGVSIGNLQPEVGSYEVSFLTVADLLRSGFNLEVGRDGETLPADEDDWTWSFDGSLNEEATAKTYILTIRHGDKTYTYTFDYVVPEGIEGNPRSLVKGVYNATLSDGHVNPWLDDKDAMAADEDGDKRVISYKGWKIWEEGVDAAVAKRLDVADLKLDDDEYVTGVRLEYGRVEAGFKTRVEEWDRELLKDPHDDVDAVTAASGDSFDDPNESVKASASRLEQVAKRFTTDASRELEEQAEQARKQAERDYAQKLIDAESYNSKMGEYAEGTLPKFAEALELPAYDGDADSISELHATVNATKTSLAAAFMLGDTPTGREAIYEAAEGVWKTDAGNGYVSKETEDELGEALAAYSLTMSRVPAPEGGADMDEASQRLLNALYKVINEIAVMGLSGRIPYAPAVIQMRLTDKYVVDTELSNSAKVDAYRNGGNGPDGKSGEEDIFALEGHDADRVVQGLRMKDIGIKTVLTVNGRKSVESGNASPVKVVDTIEYHGLMPGHKYVIMGELHAKNGTAEGRLIEGSAGSRTFVATAENGTTTVELTIPANSSPSPMVAFEELRLVIPDTGKASGYTLAEHKDINSADQTVNVTQKASDLVKTGAGELLAHVAGMALAGGALASMTISAKKNEA